MSLILKGIDLPIDSDVYILAICEKGDVYIKDGLNQYVPLRGAKAIQIPKNHGNLKDENEIKKNSIDDDYDLYVSWTDIDNAPTILGEEME